jgi:hypothetical protein
MASLLEILSAHLDERTLQQISSRLGTDQGSTSKAIAAAVPLLLSALAHNVSQPGGAQDLHNALDRDHDGTVLDNPAAADPKDGDGILGHMLGNRREAVEQGLARATGLSPSAAGPLLAVLAPIVMGALGRTQRQQGLDSNALSELLQRERQALGADAPGLMGALTGLLDRNRDGSVMDDVTSLIGGLFSRR